MKLDYDCLRDVLLSIEKQPYILSDFSINELYMSDLLNMPRLKSYKKEDIIYTVIICKEGGFIKCDIEYAEDAVEDFSISRLTHKGHLFIESIHTNEIWSKIKSVCAKLGAISIDMIENIAAKVIIQLIDTHITP